MKKRIVALVSALTLVFAMSMSVAAAGSITADDTKEISAAAGEVTSFPASQETLENSAKEAEKLLVTTETVKVAPLTDAASVKELAKEAAALKTDKVAEVKVIAVFEISGTPGKVVFKIDLKDGQTATALHLVDGKNVPVTGTKVADGVEFDFTSFSPVAIVVTTEKKAEVTPAATNQPPYNPLWDPTSPEYAAAHAAAPTAPKTGDVVMMVSIMAVIFMAGAAVAVAMSKKRA